MVHAYPEREDVRESAVRVKLASGSDVQKRLRARLLKVIRRYGGLKEWLFTEEVLIDDSEIPHSHPILTLGTKAVGTKTSLGLLSAFLHEQMHWHLTLHPAAFGLAMKDLRRAYPKVRVGRLEGGARDEESTYLHLIVCHLEVETLSILLGRSRAFDIILKKPYYRWIYQTVVDDHQKIGKIIAKRGISIHPDEDS